MAERWVPPSSAAEGELPVAMVCSGLFRGLPVYAIDVRAGELLDLDPGKLAIARQPLRLPRRIR